MIKVSSWCRGDSVPEGTRNQFLQSPKSESFSFLILSPIFSSFLCPALRIGLNLLLFSFNFWPISVLLQIFMFFYLPNILCPIFLSIISLLNWMYFFFFFIHRKYLFLGQFFVDFHVIPDFFWDAFLIFYQDILENRCPLFASELFVIVEVQNFIQEIIDFHADILSIHESSHRL